METSHEIATLSVYCLNVPSCKLHKMLDQLRSGDTVIVWKLDRPSRSLKDLLTILKGGSAAGAKFKSLTESIDTSGPAARMLMQMLGSFAEFEREMIRERTRRSA